MKFKVAASLGNFWEIYSLIKILRERCLELNRTIYGRVGELLGVHLEVTSSGKTKGEGVTFFSNLSLIIKTRTCVTTF